MVPSKGVLERSSPKPHCDNTGAQSIDWFHQTRLILGGSLNGIVRLEGRAIGAFCVASPTLLLAICATPKDYSRSRRLSSYRLPFHESGNRYNKKRKGSLVLPEVSRVWEATKIHSIKSSVIVSSILPLGPHQIFLGCS